MILSTSDINDSGRDYLEALARHDIVLLHAASSSEHQRCSGIGPFTKDGWSLSMLLDRLAETSLGLLEGSDPKGYVCGDIAWLTDYPSFMSPSGQHTHLRVTLILRLFEDRWKVVHWHISERPSEDRPRP